MIIRLNRSYQGWLSNEKLFPEGIAVRFSQDEQENADYFLDNDWAVLLDNEPEDVVNWADYPGAGDVVEEEKTRFACPLCGHETDQPALIVKGLG